MTDPNPKPLPIQAWILHCCGGCGARLPLTDMGEEPDDGDWCKADDVRELVEQKDADIEDTTRRWGLCAIRAQKAEAQRDRLAEVLRTAVELSRAYDSDNEACWDMVWACAAGALAAIDKENA